jgi:hypothetical protein
MKKSELKQIIREEIRESIFGEKDPQYATMKFEKALQEYIKAVGMDDTNLDILNTCEAFLIKIRPNDRSTRT